MTCSDEQYLEMEFEMARHLGTEATDIVGWRELPAVPRPSEAELDWQFAQTPEAQQERITYRTLLARHHPQMFTEDPDGDR